MKTPILCVTVITLGITATGCSGCGSGDSSDASAASTEGGGGNAGTSAGGSGQGGKGGGAAGKGGAAGAAGAAQGGGGTTAGKGGGAGAAGGPIGVGGASGSQGIGGSHTGGIAGVGGAAGGAAGASGGTGGMSVGIGGAAGQGGAVAGGSGGQAGTGVAGSGGGLAGPGGSGGAGTGGTGIGGMSGMAGASGSASCQIANGGCDPNATCTQAGIGVTCKCKPGYVGDGKSCMNVVADLQGLRWDLPCTDSASPACTATDPATQNATLGGATGTTYAVTLRFRGVVEQKTYNGGVDDGAFWQIGGSPGADAYNVYALTVSSPAQTYYLNRGVSFLQYCNAIDYTKTIQVDAGAMVTLDAQTIDGEEIDNVDQAGTPLVVPGVPPAPQPFVGQFVQMDVVSVAVSSGPPGTLPKSCQAILSATPGSPSGMYTVDPSGHYPHTTYCDMTTDGGGFTQVTYPDWADEEIEDMLSGWKGRQLLTCSVGGSAYIESPVFSSWTWSPARGVALPGTWNVSGTPLTCAANLELGARDCDQWYGVGCDDGSGNQNKVLPGESDVGGGLCSDRQTAHTNGGFDICGGSGAQNYGSYVVSLREEPPPCAKPSPGSALQFDDTNGSQYVTLADSATIDLTTGFTYAAWLNVSAPPQTGLWHLLAKPTGQPSDADTVAIWFESGNIHAGINVTLGGANPVSVPWTSDDGLWHHIALTYDNATGTQTLYLDGVVVGTAVASGPPSYDSNPLLIGADFNQSTYTFGLHGIVDDVRIYSTVRTPDELAVDRYGCSPVGNAGLVLFYSFDEGVGGVAKDGSTNHLDGTLGDGLGGPNSPTWVTSTAPFLRRPDRTSV